jgi:hypothetical protein
LASVSYFLCTTLPPTNFKISNIPLPCSPLSILGPVDMCRPYNSACVHRLQLFLRWFPSLWHWKSRCTSRESLTNQHDPPLPGPTPGICRWYSWSLLEHLSVNTPFRWDNVL